MPSFSGFNATTAATTTSAANADAGIAKTSSPVASSALSSPANHASAGISAVPSPPPQSKNLAAQSTVQDEAGVTAIEPAPSAGISQPVLSTDGSRSVPEAKVPTPRNSAGNSRRTSFTEAGSPDSASSRRTSQQRSERQEEDEAQLDATYESHAVRTASPVLLSPAPQPQPAAVDDDSVQDLAEQYARLRSEFGLDEDHETVGACLGRSVLLASSVGMCILSADMSLPLLRIRLSSHASLILCMAAFVATSPGAMFWEAFHQQDLVGKPVPTYGSVGRYFLPFVLNLERIRPRDFFAESSGDSKPPARTLLLGCDDGDFAFNLFKHGAAATTQVVSADIAPTLVERCQDSYADRLPEHFSWVRAGLFRVRHVLYL